MEPLRGNARAYGVLFGCLVCQMGLGFSYVFTTFLKPIAEDLGWSRAAFAALGGPLLLSMALASPVVGSVTDRFGPRRVLGVSALLLGLALAGYGLMRSLWHFYALSLLLGVALTGLGDIPVGAVASRWFDRGRGLALGVVYLGSNLGGAIVPVVATAVAVRASWREALWVLALASLALILPVAVFAVRLPDEATRVAVGAGGVEKGEASLDLPGALRTRSFWILALTLFSFYCYYLGVMNHLVAFLSDGGLSDPEAALHFSGTVAIGIGGKLAIGWLADRIPRKRALLVNFGLVTLASFLLLAVDRPGILLVFLAIHGFAVAAENVLLPLIVADAFGVRHMARIYGALMFSLLPGGALGPIFAGWAYDATGSYDVAFVCFAALNATTLLLLGFVRREAGRGSAAGGGQPLAVGREPGFGDR
jgi:sugar phosphate permease